MVIYNIRNLTYFYPGKSEPALKDINLAVNEGEFILLLGNSGSGKSTLGRVFNRIVPEFYGGKMAGEVEGSVDVGMVFQDPEKQLVMDTVEREIAFGLENIGEAYPNMRKKVMETLSFLNICQLKDRKTYELSGGQQQKVAIGAVLAMGDRFIILDEPTSQLDPASAEELMHIIKRLNEELGYTILLIEQRIDRTFHLADRILFINEGSLIFDGTPKAFLAWDKKIVHHFLPTISDFFIRAGESDPPVTVKEGRKRLIQNHYYQKERRCQTRAQCPQNMVINQEVITIKNLCVGYEKGSNVLKNVNMNICKGEVMGIAGENGSGKSTLLKTISGLLKPCAGTINVCGKVAYLSQNPNDYLFNDTTYEELLFTLKNTNACKKEYDYIIKEVLETLDLLKYKDTNPRDLSGGEKQRVALASILVMQPDIILMDEPTRGLDRMLKERLAQLILQLKAQGKTIVLVTHDVEFIAKVSDRVCLIFDGTESQIGTKYEVLTSGMFYTTEMNKLFTGFEENILTVEDALERMRV